MTVRRVPPFEICDMPASTSSALGSLQLHGGREMALARAENGLGAAFEVATQETALNVERVLYVERYIYVFPPLSCDSRGRPSEIRPRSRCPLVQVSLNVYDT